MVSTVRSAGVTDAIPALLLCLVIFLMTIMDVIIPAMSEKQYMVFPLLIRIASALSLICAALCFTRTDFAALIRKNTATLFFVFFLIWIMISSCVNGFSRDAVLGVPYRYIGVVDMISMIAAYMFCSSRICGNDLRKKVLLAYMAAADVLAAAFIADRCIGITEAFQNKNEPSAIFFHGNHYAYFLAVLIVISAGFSLVGNKKTAVYGILSFVLNLFALLMNRSTGGLIGAAAGTALFMILILIKGDVPRHRILIPFALAAVLSVTAFIFSTALRDDLIVTIKEAAMILSGTHNQYAGHGRIMLWEYTLDLIKEHPLTGFGCEGISRDMQARFGIANPHNELLTYAAYYGVPALFFYLAGVMIILYKGMKSPDEISIISACAAAGYFISSIFGVAMFYTLPFLFVMLGLASGDVSSQ